MEQLLSGLDFLHKSKVIHRDLKPANILVHIDDTPGFLPKVTLKIIDFSISRVLNDPGA
jgi:serine/threonine protein kinase